MTYKDKDRQKEANRAAAKRRRDKAKGMTQEGMTNQGMTQSITNKVLPKDVIPELPANFGQPDCECRHCRANKANGSRLTLNHGAYKLAHRLRPKEVNRVALPGDADYQGVAKCR